MAKKNADPREDAVSEFKREKVLVGKVVKAHGIRGEISVFPFSEAPDEFKSYPEVVIYDKRTGEGASHRVIRSRTRRKFAIIQLHGITNRTDAEAYKGKEVWIERRHLAPPGPDEFYWHDMKGLRVITDTGRELGIVMSLFATPGHDILVVSGQGREYLIPASHKLIVEIDKETRTLIISPPPGLLEIND